MEGDRRPFHGEDDKEVFRIFSTEVKDPFIICRGEFKGADESILVSFDDQEQERITRVQLARIEKLPDGNTVGSSIQFQFGIKDGQPQMTAVFGPYLRGLTNEEVSVYMGETEGTMSEHYRNAEFTQSRQDSNGEKYFTMPPILSIKNGGDIDEIDETDEQFVVRLPFFHDNIELDKLYFVTNKWTKLGDRIIAITPQDDQITLQLVTKASALNSPDKNASSLDVIQTMTFRNPQVARFYPSQIVEDFMERNYLNIHDSDDKAELMSQMVALHGFLVNDLGYTTTIRPLRK